MSRTERLFAPLEKGCDALRSVSLLAERMVIYRESAQINDHDGSDWTTASYADGRAVYRTVIVLSGAKSRSVGDSRR